MLNLIILALEDHPSKAVIGDLLSIYFEVENTFPEVTKFVRDVEKRSLFLLLSLPFLLFYFFLFFSFFIF